MEYLIRDCPAIMVNMVLMNNTTVCMHGKFLQCIMFNTNTPGSGKIQIHKSSLTIQEITFFLNSSFYGDNFFIFNVSKM